MNYVTFRKRWQWQIDKYMQDSSLSVSSESVPEGYSIDDLEQHCYSAIFACFPIPIINVLYIIVLSYDANVK